MLRKYHLFLISFLCVFIYELVMIFFGLQGVSLVKMVVTVLLWASVLIAFVELKEKFGFVKRIIPRPALALYILLLIWNIVSVLRSLIFRDDTVTTILGNYTTSLALLVPFALVFSLREHNLYLLLRFFIGLIYVGMAFAFISLVFRGTSIANYTMPATMLLLSPVVFLITQWPYLEKRNRFLLVFAAVLLFIVAYLWGTRTMMIRELLLFIALFPILLFHKYRSRWMFYLVFISLLSPFALMQQGIVTGVSPFERYLSDEDDLSTDTRSFLYIELYQDLLENDRLLIGKGATGKYYSDYFSRAEGDASMRINMEVGILGVVMKGGIIAAFLHLAVLFLAIFYAFFRSRNSFVVGAGFILFVHTLLLFLENVIRYSSYNFLIWFFVGICLSKQMRRLSNSDLKNLLRHKKFRRPAKVSQASMYHI